MSIYEKNMAAIQKKDQVLYHAIIQNDLEEEDIEFSIESARNGMLIVSAMFDEKIKYMNSRYNPEQEAERFAAQYSTVPDYSFMIFFGFGNGMLADKIIKSRGEHVTFLFYEPSPHLFLKVLECFDISKIIESSRVRVVVHGLNDDCIDTDISSKVNIENYRISYYDNLPLYKQLFEKEQKKVENKYRFLVNLVSSNVSTARYFGKAEAYNNIYNMRNVFFCNCEEDFTETFPTDRPAIIVAAGPSLEKNVHYLKEAKGRFLIIAVDTALRYLASQGVRPDLAIVADPQKPVKLFEDEEVQQVPLAINSAANYKIVELVKQKVIYVSSECAYYNKLFEVAGRHMYALSGGGSVATFAFVLAISWGYRKIILVGQDLALAPDKVHAGNDDIDTHKLTEGKVKIEGYYGDEVYTSPDYKFYKEWYEMVIKGDDNLEVVNATEGGAKIDGTIAIPLKEAINQYVVEPFDFEKVIREMPSTFSEEQKEEIIHLWLNSVENLKQLKVKLNDGICQIKYGIDLIQCKSYKGSELKIIQKKVAEIIEECNSFDEIYFVDCLIAEEEGDVLGDIYNAKENNEEEVSRIYEKLLKYISAMYSAVDEVRKMFEKIIDGV